MRKVVVTGIGMITPLGTGKKKSWLNLSAGECGTGEILTFDTTGHRVKIGGEVKDFDPSRFLSSEQQLKLGRGSQYTMASVLMAIEDAGIDMEGLKEEAVGFSLGSTMGEAQVLEEIIKQQVRGEKVPLEKYKKYPANNLITSVMEELELMGPYHFFFNACAAGNYAMGYAADWIRRGKVDVAFSGGTDVISQVAFTGFNRLLSLDPERCRPFDKGRKGLVVSEGSAILLLESEEHALKRGAHIYAEFKGYGLGMDAYHVTAPHPKGEGAIQSMSTAIKNADLEPHQIDYISAHGTGTPANDKAESYAISHVFGGLEKIPPVSSIKSMIGHAMGAASAIEAAASCLMLENQLLLPTIHYTDTDENCIADCVPNVARPADITHILSNSFAFGGNTACIVLSKYEKGAGE